MSRLGPRRADETAQSRGHRGRWSRIVPVLALAAVVVLLSGCSPEVAQPFTSITPQNEKTEDIQNLYKITFWASLVVFIGVQVAIGYTALRFRRRSEDRPEQVHGSRKLEIAWTVIPAAILLVLFIPTAQTIFKHANDEVMAEASGESFNVDVVGRQWWWEISYPNIPANPNDPESEPLVTANEVLVPVGANVVFTLLSNNVIHSFWVPQLSGKMDVLPGHDNKMQFIAERPGEYWGECAEFCGGSHAWMRFKVKVVPQDEFDAWVAAWRSPPDVADSRPETEDVVDAPPAFGACIACHRVSGTNAASAREGIGAVPGHVDPDTGLPNPESRGFGPNLTLLACRDTIGAGILENTPENMETWLKRTDEVKEGVYMPNYYDPPTGQGLTDEQVAEIVDYLGTLKPADGCPGADLLIGSEIPPPVVEALDPKEEPGEDPR
jgi:cytochrome c oxidase subunit 2